MGGRDRIKLQELKSVNRQSSVDFIQPFIDKQPVLEPQATGFTNVVIGELIGMTDEGFTPLVLHPAQLGSAAIRALTVIDLHALHIGRKVVLMFVGGDSNQPIVMGLLREGEGLPFAEQPGHVEVHADGERLILNAREQIVLRCGKASITLTKDGKVLIQGTYISSRSSGMNRIKGGSVQIN